MSDTALLVIDAQESFRQRANWQEVDSPTYLRNQQALIDGAKARGWKIDLEIVPRGGTRLQAS